MMDKLKLKFKKKMKKITLLFILINLFLISKLFSIKIYCSGALFCPPERDEMLKIAKTLEDAGIFIKKKIKIKLFKKK
jgi:hypothetical protein